MRNRQGTKKFRLGEFIHSFCLSVCLLFKPLRFGEVSPESDENDQKLFRRNRVDKELKIHSGVKSCFSTSDIWLQLDKDRRFGDCLRLQRLNSPQILHTSLVIYPFERQNKHPRTLHFTDLFVFVFDDFDQISNRFH